MSTKKEEKQTGGQVSDLRQDDEATASQPLPHKLENQILKLEKMLRKIRGTLKARSSSS